MMMMVVVVVTISTWPNTHPVFKIKAELTHRVISTFRPLPEIGLNINVHIYAW